MSAETTGITARATQRTGGKKKKKKNQLPIAFVLLLAVIGVAVWLTFVGDSLALFWITGIAFGVILQRSRFCFTASLRDPYLTGSTSVTKAVLIAFAVTSVGFTAIKYGFASQGLPIPGQSYVAPVSVATGVGAFMFGIGMVIAGGCASGTLMRVGEGFWMQVISLFFFVAGSLLGAFHYGWWERHFIVSAPRIFLPDVFGWLGGLLCNLAIIAVLYWAAHKWGKRKAQEL